MQIFTPKRKTTNTFYFTTNFKIKFYASVQQLVFPLFSFLIFLPGFAQNVKWENKIDPVFRSVISHSKLLSSEPQKNSPSNFKVAPSEGFIPGTSTIEKRYECIVYTKNANTLRNKNIVINSVLPSFVTAWVTLDQISQMAEMPEVSYIDAPETYRLHNDVVLGNSGASLLHQGKLNNTAYKGKNVIVAVYDSGIDWDHFDFRNPDDPTKSRILKIWDQTLTAVGGEAPPTGYSYGVEYSQAQINNELDGSPANFVREKDINGHGTHVMGIAAGNGSSLASGNYVGMAPEADLIIIKGGDDAFSVSKFVDAVTYLQGLAGVLGKPIVLNISIGNQFGPHDGSRPEEVAIDNFSASGPGRVVIISAGNDNGKNIHNRLPLAGSATAAISITVPPGAAGTDVFEYNVYVNDNSNISATVTAPGGETLTANAGQSVSNNILTNNFTLHVSNLTDPGNGDRYVDVYLERNGSNTASPEGTWTLSFTNNTSNSLTLDGWLYYISPDFSATALVGGDNQYIVASPGNATSAITTASYVGKNSWYSNAASGAYSYSAARQDSISLFSSKGPRRDEVLKPEIAAHGQAVISCLSSDQTPVTNSDVVETGLYRKNQGTSMSAPVIAGGAALLLQANPNVTASQIKNLLTSTANKDPLTELPGPTPNTTWGYGRVDVFKAASTLFNCLPANRKTYQYDAPTHNTEESGFAFTTQRIAVRFTPDVTGKLGGVFFHTSTLATGLFVEVRTNNSGNPGTLLGSLNIPDTRVAKFSWNYIDLSSLNISVTDATDYFIVLARNAGSGFDWSLRSEVMALDNRSLQSADGGTTWSNPGVDFKIRSEVYNNAQLSGNIVTGNSTDTRDVNSSNRFQANCALIAQLAPNGANAVNGSVTSKVWIEGAVPFHAGNPFVARHYEILPAANASSATGRITLYFTQAEFTAFNNTPGSTLDLPANPTDAAGKANLRIGKYAGTSSNGTGLPVSYNGGSSVILDPNDADIIWNAEFSRWEVSIDVTGFSGFIIQTNLTALPVIIEYFTGNTRHNTNVLNWKATCINTFSVLFEIERSGDGSVFNTIGVVQTTQANCSEPFNFTDEAPLPGKNFYRLKIVENTAIIKYSSVILLQNNKLLVNALNPTILSKGSNVYVTYGGEKGSLSVNDAVGRQVYQHPLSNGIQNLKLPIYTSGIFYYIIRNEQGKNLGTGKLIVE